MGLNGENGRSAAIGIAIMIAKIPTGETVDITTQDRHMRPPWRWGALAALRGPLTRSAKKRKEIAKKAAEKCWGK